MSKFISNDEVMQYFKDIEELKKSNDPNKDKKIKEIRNCIINEMSFVIDNITKKYKKFNNYEDLRQEGFIGLIKAVDRFDYKRFPNFFVYSNQWILNHVYLSARKFDVVYTKSKQRTLYCEVDLGFDENADPESYYIEDEKNLNILQVINNLNEREREIIKSLYGIGTERKTLRQIGSSMDLSYERVRQLGNIALKKLNNKKVNLMDKDF